MSISKILSQSDIDRCYIKSRLSYEELLAQLAEEGAELTHAALKLRRAIDRTNPTPVQARDAMDMLKEEVADVLLLIKLLNVDLNDKDIQETMERKTMRWVYRLKESKGNGK